MTDKRVTAGPFTLVIPPNGRATLFEANQAGEDRECPWGNGHFEALVQFAGEVLRLRAMARQMQVDRDAWNADARRLSAGLMAIHAAPDTATTAALKSVAYDIALNCIDAETAVFQIERRSGGRLR